MTRSLHLEPEWPFLHYAILAVYQWLAKLRKGPNDQIFTLQAWRAIFIAPYDILSDPPERSQMTFLHEQFISGWPSPERS